MSAQLILHFDPLTADFAQDPYPAYAALRAHDGPFYYADIDTWMLARFADVEAVALGKSMLRSLDELQTETERRDAQRKMNWHDMPHHERFVQFSMLDSEGAVHDRLRRLVMRAFTPSIVARQRDAIQRFVDGLLDGLSNQPTVDFVGDFAAHIPGHIIGRVLGVPDADCPQLRVWSENVVRFFNVGCDDNDKALAETATAEFYHYLQSLLTLRAKTPQDDLLTQLLDAQLAGEMSEDELISTCMLILMAGHGSTIDVLGSGMHALLRFPEQHAKLRADPTLIDTAVQEMFRFESPLPYFHRFATRDCTVAGRDFAAGTRFGLLYGAANRDPARFDLPDGFDVTRHPNKHIAFGKGVHFCLGNHLARLDMDVIFTTVLARFSKIELAEDAPIYKRGLSVRGPEALHISWRPA